MNEIELPALPHAWDAGMYDSDRSVYTAEDMKEYALDAIARYASGVAPSAIKEALNNLCDEAQNNGNSAELVGAWRRTVEAGMAGIRVDRGQLIERVSNSMTRHGVKYQAGMGAMVTDLVEDLAGAVWDGPNTASQVDPCMGLPAKGRG